MFNERCQDFSINQIPPPPPPPSKPPIETKPPTNSTNNATEHSQVNVLGIILGIMIPLPLLGGAGFACWWYLRKKRLQGEQELAETRKKRKEEGGATSGERKKASEFDKGRVEKRMEEEVRKEIEEIDKRCQEMEGKNGKEEDHMGLN